MAKPSSVTKGLSFQTWKQTHDVTLLDFDRSTVRADMTTQGTAGSTWVHKSYRVFTRTWWRENPAWPSGLEPCPGKKHTLARHMTEEEARAFCKTWNATHKPGRLSRKAEFTSE